MGCPTECEIEDNLVFSICTHDPDTGVLTDADDAPSYRVYEDETATPILTGNMAKLDDDNTTGFYTELIACTAANGFEGGKTYTIYIQATVDTDTGGICYGFKVINNVWDENISLAQHATDGTAGLYLKQIWASLVTRTAQCGDAGTATTIDLDAGASDVDDYYKGMLIAIVLGTGAGQARACTAYDGTTRIATVGPAWATSPDGDSYFAIINTGSSVVASGALTVGQFMALK